MRETNNFYMVVLSEEDGVWLIEAVGLQGVRSFGRTVSSAVANVREAIAAAEGLDHQRVAQLASESSAVRLT
jgi:predicted RNase H-like HicB family nuclease